MLALSLLGLLLLKHGFLAHVVDLGYSQARQNGRPGRLLWLALHTTLECVLTAILLYAMHLPISGLVLELEALAHLSSCWLERNAPISRLLLAHLYSEVWVLLLYAATAIWALCNVA